MAKIKLNDNSWNNTVKDGVLISGAGTTGTIYQAANNNRGRSTGSGSQSQMGTSPSFTMLDNQITNLDALYDVLPDQTPWVTYAENIADQWQLCASCAPMSSGKKLFRQYNFNRQSIGLSVVDVPVDDEEFCEVDEIHWVFGVDPSLGNIGFFTEAGIYVPTWIQAQVGKVLSNPIALFPVDGAGGPWLPGDALYQLWQQCTPMGVTPGCIFTQTGAPGAKASLTREN